MIGRALAAALGATASAVGAAACCAPPFLVGLLGLSSAGLGGAIQPYRPAFLSASGAFFFLGILWVRRRERAGCTCGKEGEDVTDADVCAGRRSAGRARGILWAGLVASVALAFYPEWTAWL